VSAASDKVKRLLFLVPYVASRRQGVPIVELAKLLGTTRGELLSEIDLACRVGPPLGDPGEFVLLTVEEGRVFAELPQRFVRPPRLTTPEAFALLLGAQALRGSGIEPYVEATARAARKLRRALEGTSAEMLGRLESEILITAEGTADGRGSVVPELARAVRKRCAVCIDYYSAGSASRKKRGVDPYGLINGKGAWYLVGRCHINDDTRVFKAERIAEVEVLDAKFEIPAGFDLDRFGKDRLKLPAGRRGPVRLRFRGDIARQAASWKGARKSADGSVEVHVQVSASERLASWVLNFAGDCEVLAPDELRAAVAERFRAVARLHE
jgi:proteasome accessory factor C